MFKVRAKVEKILEDGTAIELLNTTDDPWYVSPVLKALGKQLHMPAPVVKLEGQGEMFT